MNNQALLIWQQIFGTDLLPNDCEIIGVEQDGSLIYYDAQKGECYITGVNLNDHDEQLNEREHIMTHPLAYVALLRNALKACAGATKTQIKTIMERSLSADPHRYVSDLAMEGRNNALKQQVETKTPKQAKGSTPLEHAMMANEPHLRGEDGLFITATEFANRCHVLSASGTTYIGGKAFRKHAVLFGKGDDRRWKYIMKFYCNGGKKEALRRAFILVKFAAMGKDVQDAGVDFSHFQANYDQKIPLQF